MSKDSKNSHLLQNTAICILLVTPFVFSGYAAHAHGIAWLAVAVAWCALLIVFLTYIPDDED